MYIQQSTIHTVSPLLYVMFVEAIRLFEPCPNSKFMKLVRKIHNITLSEISLILFLGITFGSYLDNKFSSLNNLMCLSYDNNNFLVNKSVELFLYSKYLEWFDTFYIHLSGKPITQLQYTHHMTTALVVYINSMEYISPSMIVPMGLNCLVHIPMYWYFAFPKGALNKYKRLITISQIGQHIIVISGGIYTHLNDDCKQNKYGNNIGLVIYFMYLFYFTSFYINSYMSRMIKKK